MINRHLRLSRILDECLDLIREGRSTVDDCLKMYPDEADQLAPMLAVAVEAHELFAPGKPRPDYVAASRRRIEAILSLRQLQAQVPRRREKPVRQWKPAWRFISLVFAVVVLISGTGVVYAAGGALPGDPLYGFKRGIERARLVVTWSASGHARVLAQHADERLAEVEELIAAKRYDGIGLALDGFEDTLSGITDLAGDSDAVIDPDLMAQILDRLAHHQEVLQRVREQLPENAQAAIDRALERSSHSMEVILLLSQGGNPSELAPGQQRTPPGLQRTSPGQQAELSATSTPTDTAEPTETSTPTPVPPTATPTPVPLMHLRDLDAQRLGPQGVLVTIQVVTSGNLNLGYATVIGTWTVSGPGVTYSCETTPSGRCLVFSGDLPISQPTTFTVTTVIHPSYDYAPWRNSDVDGDSNGTSITDFP